MPQCLSIRWYPVLALLAALLCALVAASVARTTVSESVILVKDLGVMLETRRRCWTRLRAFLETYRLRGVFINEVSGNV